MTTILEETTRKGSNPMQDKGKRNIVDNAEAEQNCKFKADPLVEKVGVRGKEVTT